MDRRFFQFILVSFAVIVAYSTFVAPRHRPVVPAGQQPEERPEKQRYADWKKR